MAFFIKRAINSVFAIHNIHIRQKATRIMICSKKFYSYVLCIKEKDQMFLNKFDRFDHFGGKFEMESEVVSTTLVKLALV